MVWYGAQKTDAVLRIATSLDGVSFAEVESAPLEGHGTRTSLRTFVPQSARWVRLALQPTDGHPCPSVYEVGIHGEASEREASAR
jgi:hypothetical protein